MHWSFVRRSGAIAYALIVLIIGGFVNSYAEDFLQVAGKAVSSVAPAWLWNGLEGEGGTVVAFLLSIVIFGLAANYGLKRSGKLLGSSAKMIPSDEQGGIAYVVMGYSPMEAESRSRALAELSDHGVDHVAKSATDYRDACLSKGLEPNEKNKWQQNIRAVYHHRDRLERILILPPNNDAVEQDDFKLYLEKAFAGRPNMVSFITDKRGKPFQISRGFEQGRKFYEDYDYVFLGVSRGLKIIQKQNPSVDSVDICVDATSGTKTFSIAAAIATLNASCIFSYVNPNGEIRFYNASVDIGQGE